MEMSAHPSHKKRGRKGPKTIRYHRVDLGDDDFLEEDEESRLDRELGKSSHSRKGCKISKCCRNCSICCTVLIALMGIGFIVTYSVITAPTEQQLERQFWDIYGGIKHQLLDDATNSSSSTVAVNTTAAEEVASNITATVTTPMPYNSTGDAKPKPMVINAKTRSLSNFWKSQKELLQLQFAQQQLAQKQLEEKKQQQQLRTRHGKRSSGKPESLWREIGFEMPRNTISLQPLFEAQNREFEPNVADVTAADDSKASHDDIKKSDEVTTDAPKTDVSTQAMIHNATVQSVNSTTAAPTMATSTETTVTKTKILWHERLETIKEQWRSGENMQTFLVASTVLVLLMLLMFLCCVWRRIRARKAAKKRHFSRLVNDLNASERFTLVAPSDEESD